MYQSLGLKASNVSSVKETSANLISSVLSLVPLPVPSWSPADFSPGLLLS